MRVLCSVLRRLIVQRRFVPESCRAAQPRGLDSLVLAALCVLKGVAQHAQARPLWQAVCGRACATLFEPISEPVPVSTVGTVLPALCGFHSAARHAQAWPVDTTHIKMAYRQSYCGRHQQVFVTSKRLKGTWCTPCLVYVRDAFGVRNLSCAANTLQTGTQARQLCCRSAAGDHSRVRWRQGLPTASASEAALALLKQRPAGLLFSGEVLQTSAKM